MAELALRGDPWATLATWISESTDEQESQLRLFRRCVRCGESKPDSEFHNSRTNQYSYCASCRRAYDRWHYQERSRPKRLARKRISRAAAREWLDSLKADVPCADCKGVFPAFVMHFDHLPGYDKVGPVSALARERTREVTLEELTKCELVCANCHAIRTTERRRRKPKS